MRRLYTIGFAGKTLEEFVNLLHGARVDRLIDVRLRPASQLSGYARQADLAYILRHYEGIEYRHEPELAPAAELLDAYRQSKDWQAYEERFRQLMEARATACILARAIEDARAPVLLCSEAAPDRCHRRLLAEDYARHEPVDVCHL